MQTTVRVVTFACEWVFLSAHDMMTSVTGSNISQKSVCGPLSKHDDDEDGYENVL